MSQQQNNRISYASIAGRKTNKANDHQSGPESSRNQSNTPNSSKATIVDEYPPIGGQTLAVKCKNNNVEMLKQENNNISFETARSEPLLDSAPTKISSVLISSSEPTNCKGDDSLTVAISELAIESTGSKLASPQSPQESAKATINNDSDILPQPRPKSWSALFKKAEAQPDAKPNLNLSTVLTSPTQDNREKNAECTKRDESCENNDQSSENEDLPSCSKNIEQFTNENPTYYNQQEYDASSYPYPMGMNMLSMAAPAYMPPPYAYPQYGFMMPSPMNMIPPGAFYQPPGYVQAAPMEQMQMLPSGPGGAIAHPVHGMVYYQYDAEVPMDAGMVPTMYPPPVLVPQHIPRTIKPLMSLPTNQYPDGVVPVQKPQIDGWNNAVDNIMLEQKIAGKMDLFICDRYQTYLKISKGSCGTVFAAVDLLDPNKKTVAIKFEELYLNRGNLHTEYEVYKTCSYCEMNDVQYGTPTEGFARIYWMGSQYKYKILIMELLGPSLENLFQYSMRQFSPETIFRLGNQILDRIEYFHRMGYIHRDIKPDNFVMGLGEQEDTVYMIDFGLCRKFRNIGNAEPTYRKDKSLVGTAKYASTNSHKGMQLARRDDLESIGYILIEFIVGELPWKAEVWKNCSRDTIYKNMLEMKKTANWSLKCPEMADWMKYVTNLGFDDMPDYSYLRELLMKYLESAHPNKSNFLSEHVSKYTFPVSQKQSKRKKGQREEKNESCKEKEKINVLEKVEQSTFEWKTRRECSPNDKYSYECLYRWILPYGQEPQRPPGHNPSNVFGTGPGEGGFA